MKSIFLCHYPNQKKNLSHGNLYLIFANNLLVERTFQRFCFHFSRKTFTRTQLFQINDVLYRYRIILFHCWVLELLIFIYMNTCQADKELLTHFQIGHLKLKLMIVTTKVKIILNVLIIKHVRNQIQNLLKINKKYTENPIILLF